MKAEIVSIGTELLLGEITDTNASFLASQLPLLGIDLYWISQVGDNQARMVEVFKRAWQRSELILTTGGLGPTDDDLTREAIAEMFDEKPELEPSLERGLQERFGRIGIAMSPSNLKQATVIPSAEPIINERGTAPGWWVERDGHILVAMPGPPAELLDMWQKRVQPRLQQRSIAIIVSKTFKTFGLPESTVGEMVAPLTSSANPTLGVYAKTDGIQLRLTAKAETREQAEMMIAEGEVSVRNIMGEYIWGTDDDTLETAVGRLLVEKGLSLAIIEDYSGGWLTAGIANIPESPAFFKGGLVASSDEAKIAFGVSNELLSQHNAVSPEVAQAMAEDARNFFKADIGVSITGTEETGDRPMGTVYIGIADINGSRVINRIQGRRRVTSAVLMELRNLIVSMDK